MRTPPVQHRPSGRIAGPWSRWEDTLLGHLSRSGYGLLVMVAMLDRSYDAIARRRFLIDQPRRRARVWWPT